MKGASQSVVTGIHGITAFGPLLLAMTTWAATPTQSSSSRPQRLAITDQRAAGALCENDVAEANRVSSSGVNAVAPSSDAHGGMAPGIGFGGSSKFIPESTRRFAEALIASNIKLA